MGSKGQNWTAAHAAENMQVEMEYSDKLHDLRRERKEKIHECQAKMKEAKRKRDADIANVNMDIEKRRLLVQYNIDTLKDQRTLLRQRMHDYVEADNDINQGELMRLTGDIDANRHRLLELDEERQLRTAQCKTIYENTRETIANEMAAMNQHYRIKARELREEVMATYRLNRQKAEQERQEGGEEV